MTQISTDSCSTPSGGAYFAFSSLVIFGEKAQSAHIITFDFYFHLEHSKGNLHS